MSKDLLFDVPPDRAKALLKSAKEGSKYKIVDGVVKGRSPSMWFTNIDHNKTRTKLDLVSRYSPENYPSYDDYDAILVGRAKDIPMDWGCPSDFFWKEPLVKLVKVVTAHPLTEHGVFVMAAGWR